MNLWNKNVEHFKDFSRYFWERLLCIIIGILVIIGFTFFIFSNSQIITPENVENQQIMIWGISLENFSIWFTFVAIIVTAFWSTFQYNKSKLSKQQEKASEIAEIFSNDLVTKCYIIYDVISNTELIEILEINKIDYDKFKVFNTNEIRTVYNDDNFISTFKKKYKELNLDQLYYRRLESRISFNSFKELMNQNKQYTEKEARELFTLNNSNFPFHFSTLISDVLNTLEYLCMSLSSQAAGSKYVYQSLHQAFLRTVRLLCVNISMSNNQHYSDKYYTNIIHVYNEWTTLYLKDLSKENKQKNKVNKILNPKIKTV